MKFIGGDDHMYDPDAYLEHLAEHVDRGEMTVRQALDAATMISTGRSLDITREYQVALIAIGAEELAHRFNNVSLVVTKAGMGLAIGIDKDQFWDTSDADDDERLALNTASMACMRRAGLDCELEDGRIKITAQKDDDEDIIDAFIQELNDLPEEDPNRRGWDKWTK